jgi:hypothetical protein
MDHRARTDHDRPPAHTREQGFVTAHESARLASKGFRPRSQWSSMGTVGEYAGRDFDRSRSEHERGRRHVTVAEAAEVLGITAEAVRTRIKRGKLDSIKDPPQPGGTVYVLLEADPTRPNIDPTSQGQDQTIDQTRAEELVDELRDRIAFLERQLQGREEELRRRDAILMNMTEVMKAIGPPSPSGDTEAHASPREGAPESSPSPGPIGTTADAGEGQETAAEATDRGDVPGAHSEAPEEARAWRLTRLQEVLLVLIAIVSLSALLYIVVTVLST